MSWYLLCLANATSRWPFLRTVKITRKYLCINYLYDAVERAVFDAVVKSIVLREMDKKLEIKK